MAKKNKNSGFDLLAAILAIPFLILCALVDIIVNNVLLSVLITAVLCVAVGGTLLSKAMNKFGQNLNIDQMDGHDFEYWCADLLRKSGFTRVEVTRGSGDQGVDIIAFKDGMKYAIQCKRYNKALSNKPIQEVHTGKTIYNCDVAAVMTNNYFTPSAKEAARATGVLLWDRTALQRMASAAERL